MLTGFKTKSLEVSVYFTEQSTMQGPHGTKF